MLQDDDLRRTCSEAAGQSVGVHVLLVLCVCVRGRGGGGDGYKSITNMLHAHSRMCTCMQTN